jgi:hypothetical protein
VFVLAQPVLEIRIVGARPSGNVEAINVRRLCRRDDLLVGRSISASILDLSNVPVSTL